MSLITPTLWWRIRHGVENGEEGRRLCVQVTASYRKSGHPEMTAVNVSPRR